MKEKLIEKINVVLKDMGVENADFLVEIPKDEKNGDYSSNVAMKLAKVLHKSPNEIGQEIVDNIDREGIKNIELVGPGFINFYMEKDYLIKNIDHINNVKLDYGRNENGKGKKINIEFVSANPTGILHMGNARGGAYGDSLARIFKFNGYDVVKEYYVNDAGVQIDNLGKSIRVRYLNLLGIKEELPENGYHGNEIVDIAKELFEKNGDSLKDADLEYFKKYGIDYLLGKIKEDLKRYRIEYDVFSSEKDIRTNYSLEEFIDKLDKNGYIYDEDGAKWFKCSLLFDDKDHVLQKEDGTYTYLMPDIIYHYDKYKRGFDKMIDVLGTDHHGYVARLKSSVKALGNDPDKLEVKLLQLVRLMENGEVVKMSKRSGKSITLSDLMDDVGVNAARYYFSKVSLDTQMDFNLNLAKEKSNENPVFYINYAYARICSILSNYEKDFKIKEYTTLNNENAYSLLKVLYEWPEVVKSASDKELPHLIANYAYDLASAFHSYYDKVRIISDDETSTKENINLLFAIKYTLKISLELIGVEPIERM